MTVTSRYFSPRASLAALGLSLRRLGLCEAIAAHVRIRIAALRKTLEALSRLKIIFATQP
jgi:hypothetical protein